MGDVVDSNLKKLAFFQEFPFLSRYANRNRTDFVKVKRVDESLLGQKKMWGRIYLLDKNGNKLAKVRLKPIWSILGKQETIIDSLSRISERVDEVCYILSIYGWMDYSARDEAKVSLNVYKMPAQKTLRDLVEEMTQKHQQEAHEV